MRYTLFIVIAILLTTSSCRFPRSLSEMHTDSPPYVQLKDGKKISGNAASMRQRAFAKDKILLDDTSFKAKDVAFYSMDGVHYANTGKSTFAKQVASGKINFYKLEYTTMEYSNYGSGYGAGSGYGGNRMTQKRHINYYIQKGEWTPLKSLTYNHLKPMVAPNTPEFKMLESYRKTRIVSRSLGYASLAMIVGGFVLAASNNDKTSNAGVTVAGAGFGAFFGWLGVYLPNKMKLYKTVIIADGLEKKRGRNKDKE